MIAAPAPATVRPPTGSELLDDPTADPELVRVNLRDLARANRWFGGWAAVRFGLAAALRQRRHGSRISMLDVGPGAADLSAAAVRWAERRGMTLTPYGVEQHRAVARVAHAQGLPVAAACGRAIPLATASVDVVLVSQVAHHLESAEVIDLLRECARVARHAVVLADLRRSAVARAAFRFGARLLGFHSITVADGLTSIRRGFTAAELRALVQAAGLAGIVADRPWFRLVAVIRREA